MIGLTKIEGFTCGLCGQSSVSRYPDQHHCLDWKTCRCVDCRIKRNETGFRRISRSIHPKLAEVMYGEGEGQ